MAVDHQNGIFRGESDVVERIGGQPAQSLDAFIREHRTVFGAAKAAASGNNGGHCCGPVKQGQITEDYHG